MDHLLDAFLVRDLRMNKLRLHVQGTDELSQIAVTLWREVMTRPPPFFLVSSSTLARGSVDIRLTYELLKYTLARQVMKIRGKMHPQVGQLFLAAWTAASSSCAIIMMPVIMLEPLGK